MADQTYLYNQRLKFYDAHEKPQPGTWYTVPKGSWLDSISMSAYGQDRTHDIINANPFLSTRPIHAGSKLPYIHPGDKLWLPPASNQQTGPDTIDADDPEEIAIRINGKIYRGWETSSVIRSLETCADSFTFVANYDPDSEESKVLDPYTYYKADLFVGGEKYIAGEMLKWTPDPAQGSMTVEVRSLSGVIVDCPSLDKRLDYNGMTLKQISDSLLKPFGIIAQFPDKDSDAFIKANREITSTVFEFLAKLAKQKGFVITSSQDNEILFVRAAIKSKPIAALIAGKFPLLSVNGASFDGSARFSHYIAVSQSAGQVGNKAEEKDNTISAYRPLIFTADDTEAGNIKDAAKWKRSRALAASMPISATVKGWRDPDGALWRENKKVTILYPRACIFEETEFLITSVSLKKDASSGNIAELTLSLPQAFTLDFPEELPWQR